ncbi:MAG TPA: DUF484 family protein [Burkholderiales bacterium]|nr:DUF484 family protein [Burkholderiales bacterium]
MIDSEEVARYLQENPGFAEQYADILASIYVPHPHDGRAIPIGERQLITLREKNRLLETKLRELIKFGEENDAIGEKMQRLSIGLLKARSIEALFYVLENSLREDFEVPHVAIRIWGTGSGNIDLPEFSDPGKGSVEIAESLVQPHCGHHVASDLLGWFEGGEHLRSFALLPLREEKTIGLLVLASEDPQRFAPDIGTLYLKRLGEWVTAALSRF